jgi:hypothetical protein
MVVEDDVVFEEGMQQRLEGIWSEARHRGSHALWFGYLKLPNPLQSLSSSSMVRSRGNFWGTQVWCESLVNTACISHTCCARPACASATHSSRVVPPRHISYLSKEPRSCSMAHSR